MAGKRWNVNPRFVICEDETAISTIVSGVYPVGTIMYRQDLETFSKWNGTAWIPLSFEFNNSFIGKKTGRYYGQHATAGSGLLSGMASVGTAVGNDIDYTNNTGSYFIFRTAATTDAVAGHKQAAFITSRELNAIFATKILPVSTSNNRIFAGLKATTADLPAGSDDPLSTINGIGLLKRSTDTTWQIISCAWQANSQIIDTEIPISNTVPVTCIIQAINSTPEWRFSMDLGASWENIPAGNAPAADTRQCYINEVQSVDGSAQDLRIYDTLVVSDK